MDRDKGSSSGGKFGKFLAIGMAISLIWGILLIVVGIYIQSNFSSIVQGMMGKVSDVVKTDAAKNNDQNICPVDDTIDPNTKWGDWYDQMLAWILALGVATCLFAVLGFFGGLKHHKTALYLTVVILLITAVLFLIVIIMAADPESSIHSDAQDKLINKLQSDYAIEAKASTANSLFIKALNAIMLWVPPACCNRNFFKTDGSSVAAFERLRDCAVKGTETAEQVNTKGCYNEVYSKLSSTITAILILILVWDILMLLLSILTIMEIRPDEEARESMARGDLKKEQEDEAPPVKKFVPFAKISSFVHPDVNRIKSTDIW